MQSRARANKAGERADAGEDGVMAKAEKSGDAEERRRWGEEGDTRRLERGDANGPIRLQCQHLLFC